MNSVISYPDRGQYGRNDYRGNCSGYVIKDLIKQFYPGSKPKKFVEVFSRWWYRKGCCQKFKYNK